jgi:hypothetical protein
MHRTPPQCSTGLNLPNQITPDDLPFTTVPDMFLRYAHLQHQNHTKKHTFQFAYLLMMFEYMGAPLHAGLCCANGAMSPNHQE